MSKKTKKRFPQRNSRAALAEMSKKNLLARRVRGLRLYYGCKLLGYSEIARRLGVSRQAVHQWCKAAAKDEGPVAWATILG